MPVILESRKLQLIKRSVSADDYMGDTEEERHKLDKKMINFQTDLGQMLNPVVTNSCL